MESLVNYILVYRVGTEINLPKSRFTLEFIGPRLLKILASTQLRIGAQVVGVVSEYKYMLVYYAPPRGRRHRPEI